MVDILYKVRKFSYQIFFHQKEEDLKDISDKHIVQLACRD